jgi:hypothetical protein
LPPTRGRFFSTENITPLRSAFGAILRITRLLFKPSRLQERDARPAAFATNCPCPEVGNGRGSNPTRVARIVQIEVTEEAIEGSRIGAPASIRLQQSYRPLIEIFAAGFQRYEFGIDGITVSEARLDICQNALTPRSHVPREIRLNDRVVRAEVCSYLLLLKSAPRTDWAVDANKWSPGFIRSL